MISPELDVIAISLVFITMAYTWIYPNYCGSDGNKIAVFDALISLVLLLIIGSHYWETGTEFSIVVTTLNWFWFTALVNVLVELPVALWYYKKHDVWETWRNEAEKDRRAGWQTELVFFALFFVSGGVLAALMNTGLIPEISKWIWVPAFTLVGVVIYFLMSRKENG